LLSPLPTAGNGEALLFFGGMPETSVARGRAGGGQAPQEGFSLGNFEKTFSYPQGLSIFKKIFLVFIDLSCF
jgi:hypothetical protein